MIVGSQGVQQVVQALIVHEAQHLAVVDQHHRRVGTGTQAFAGLHGEQTIGGCAVGLDAEFAAHVSQCSFAVTQLARQVGADVELELAHRLLVVHVVEGRDLVHRDGRHAEIGRDAVLGLR